MMIHLKGRAVLLVSVPQFFSRKADLELDSLGKMILALVLLLVLVLIVLALSNKQFSLLDKIRDFMRFR